MSEATSVQCGTCGFTRPVELVVAEIERPPCPKCGAQNLHVTDLIVETALAADSMSWELTPGDQDIGWMRRWKTIQCKLSEVTADRTSPSLAQNIHQAATELRGFYVLVYHLKDALKNDVQTTGIAASQVESAINASPELSLLADLANLDKHGKLSNSPRSGTVPVFGKISATSTDAGWLLVAKIHHGNQVHDGIELAKLFVNAWLSHFRQWGLRGV